MLRPVRDHRLSSIFVVGPFEFLEKATFGVPSKENAERKFRNIVPGSASRVPAGR